MGMGVLEEKKKKEHSRAKSRRKKVKSRMNLWAVNGALNWPVLINECYKCCLRS